jgi:hypothetical protein
VKKQSIVVYFEVNETCCIEARHYHEKLREDELRSWRSRQQERYELFQQPSLSTVVESTSIVDSVPSRFNHPCTQTMNHPLLRPVPLLVSLTVINCVNTRSDCRARFVKTARNDWNRSSTAFKGFHLVPFRHITVINGQLL